MERYLNLFGEFIRNPRQIGAIAPSSSYLARAITSWPLIERAQTVVEIGPGTGPFTPFILERLRPGAQFFAMEINDKLSAQLRSRHPGLKVYCDCATQIQKYLQQHGATHADCIISSLPWAAFGTEFQDRLLASLCEALRPGGRFVTFAYLQGTILPSGRRFQKCPNRHFESVTHSPVIWRNLPPAFLYQCIKSDDSAAAIQTDAA